MKTVLEDTYRGWTITIRGDQNMCSNFSFDVTAPSGKTQTVTMGGDNEQRAMERAREMIDMECEFAAED